MYCFISYISKNKLKKITIYFIFFHISHSFLFYMFIFLLCLFYYSITFIQAFWALTLVKPFGKPKERDLEA